MKAQDLPVFQKWAASRPREAYALSHLPEDDTLKDEIVSAILNENVDELTSLKVSRLADAVDLYEIKKTENAFIEPFRWGIRRPITARFLSTIQVKIDNKLYYRVDFQTEQGWSGYFYTRSPKVLSRIKANMDADFTLVGEVKKRRTCFYVEFGGQITVTR